MSKARYANRLARTAEGGRKRDIDWWIRKIGKITAFGPVVAPRWAQYILNKLSQRGSVHGDSVGDVAKKLGVPQKFGARSIALLTSSGLVKMESADGMRLVLQEEALKRRKNRAQMSRRRPTKQERDRLLEAERFKCARCGRHLPADKLEIHHLIPLARLGVDQPCNWVALCPTDNRLIWGGFTELPVRFYRGRRLKRPPGVRFKRGYFWPMVEGKLRTETRAQWKQEMTDSQRRPATPTRRPT